MKEEYERILVPLILQKAGQAIHGETHWVSALGRDLGVTKRKMQRLLAGKDFIADPVWLIGKVREIALNKLANASFVYVDTCNAALTERNRTLSEIALLLPKLKGEL